MLRRTRCKSCGSTFYVDVSAGAIPECQDCTGSHDSAAQAKRDAEAILAATSRPTGEPQSVNPRTGKSRKPTTTKKEQAE